ncbi:MAG: hypothetical protein R3F61_14965 [Myxococcota bacterium]
MSVLLLAAALASPPSHPVCGGIPGGMYDDVARIGDVLSVSMHRYISDDADAHYLGALFADDAGQTVGRWRGEHTKPFRANDVWVHRAEIPIPSGASEVRLFDLHHDRACTIQLGADGSTTIVRVERTGSHANPELPQARQDPEFADETLEGDAVDVKRGRRARLAAKELEEPPENLEQRALLLAKLKQNLPRMSRRQVLEWMGHQGFRPDDPDVLETLGEDWLSHVPE